MLQTKNRRSEYPLKRNIAFIIIDISCNNLHRGQHEHPSCQKQYHIMINCLTIHDLLNIWICEERNVTICNNNTLEVCECTVLVVYDEYGYVTIPRVL